MKNTIITLASIATLSGAAHAQTFMLTSASDTSVTFLVSQEDNTGNLTTGNLTFSSDTGSLFGQAGTESLFPEHGAFVAVNINQPNDVVEWSYTGAPIGDMAQLTLLGIGGVTMSTVYTPSIMGARVSDNTVQGVNPVDRMVYSIGDTLGKITGDALFDGITADFSYVDGSVTTTGGEGESYGIAINLAPVPEPSSTALLGLGALGLLIRRMR